MSTRSPDPRQDVTHLLNEIIPVAQSVPFKEEFVIILHVVLRDIVVHALPKAKITVGEVLAIVVIQRCGADMLVLERILLVGLN